MVPACRAAAVSGSTDYEERSGCLFCYSRADLDAFHTNFRTGILFVVFPITFINLSEGLAQRDRALFEMAKVFRVPMGKQLRYLYIPQVMPFLLSGCRVSVGMAWKSGVAGEIIGLTNASIGEQLYLSKLYLNIDDLFAWTIVIICISLLCERAVVALLERLQRRWENAYGNSL